MSNLFRPRLIVTLAVMGTIWQPSATLAAYSAWRSKLVQSANGQYVLAMIAPQELAVADNSRETAIRNRYPQSGLYRRTRTRELLWKIDLPWNEDAFVANDGQHVLLASIDWTGQYFQDDDLLRFYTEGKLITRYNAFTLIRSLTLKSICCSLLDHAPFDCSSMRFDPDAATYSFQTNHGESFTFSLASGQATDHRSPWPFYLAAILASGPVLVYGILRLPFRIPANRGEEMARPYRFGLQRLFGIVTIACVYLAAWRINMPIAYLLVFVATLGAVVARHRSQAPAAAAVGAVLAVYGLTLGVIALVSIVDVFVLLDGALDENWPHLGSLTTPLLLITYCGLAGALTARILANRRLQWAMTKDLFDKFKNEQLT